MPSADIVRFPSLSRAWAIAINDNLIEVRRRRWRTHDAAMPRSPEYEIGKALIAARDRWPRLVGALVAESEGAWIIFGRYLLPKAPSGKAKDLRTGAWMTDDEVFCAVDGCAPEEVYFRVNEVLQLGFELAPIELPQAVAEEVTATVTTVTAQVTIEDAEVARLLALFDGDDDAPQQQQPKPNGADTAAPVSSIAAKPETKANSEDRGDPQQEPPQAEPDARAPDEPGDLLKPVIQLIGGRLPEIATDAESALLAAGVPIYRRSQDLVRPVVETVDASHNRKTKVARLTAVTAPYMRDVLARVAHWHKWRARERDWVATDPPADIAATIMNRFGEWRLHPTTGVLTTPTLRPDGSILSQPGYDPATRLILMSPPTIPDIEPTRLNAERALLVLDALLDEFPFADQRDVPPSKSASRSVALSGLITPVVRGAFPVAPMHVATAPVASSGKSHLWDTVASIANGHLMPVMAAGRTEEETEKRLTALLLKAQPLISIDNVNGVLGGDFLCQAVERQLVDVRVLENLKMVVVEPRGTTYFATGNNIQIRGDMTRRAIRCTLDPMQERPELRQFKGDPVATVLANRGRYLAAAFCVIRSYLAAGRPDPAPKLASFEDWSDMVRSALIWLGRADPCETMKAVREDDPEQALLEQVIAAWNEAIGRGWENRQTVAQLIGKFEERDGVFDSNYRHPELRNAMLATAGRAGRIDARGFGYWLRRYKDRVVSGQRLRNKSDEHAHSAEWWIEEV